MVGIGTGTAGAVRTEGAMDVGGVVMREVWNLVITLNALLLAKERPAERMVSR